MYEDDGARIGEELSGRQEPKKGNTGKRWEPPKKTKAPKEFVGVAHEPAAGVNEV
jgi:hypothetical protein